MKLATLVAVVWLGSMSGCLELEVTPEEEEWIEDAIEEPLQCRNSSDVRRRILNVILCTPQPE